jgi:hypothetical protein
MRWPLGPRARPSMQSRFGTWAVILTPHSREPDLIRAGFFFSRCSRGGAQVQHLPGEDIRATE